MRLAAAILGMACVLPSLAHVDTACSCCPTWGQSGLTTFSVEVGDLDADGKPEYVVASPTFTSDGQGLVEVYSGAAQTLLFDLVGGAGDLHFGFSVVAPGDVDGDGVPDLSIGALSIHENASRPGRILVFSGATRQPLWSLDAWVDDDGTYGLTARVPGDVDGNGWVDVADYGLVLAELNAPDSTTYSERTDVDLDGFTTAYDAIAVADAIGIDHSIPAALHAHMQEVVAAGAYVDDKDFQGVHQQGSIQHMAGPIGCLWCFFKCGKALKEAADCMTSWNDFINQCLEDACGDIEKEIECWEQRPGYIKRCLKEVAESIPECAKCITKCGPRP